MSPEPTEQDALRPCPICRTPISVLAVRCRHCGSEVGRPRREAETFTIRDLGGGSETTYTVSGNVLDALEIFRAEERSAQEKLRRAREAGHSSWFRLRHRKEDEEVKENRLATNLPQLDAKHRELAMLGRDSQGPGKPEPASSAGMEFVRRCFIGGGVVVGLLVIYFAGDYAWKNVSAYMNRSGESDEFVYVNRALQWLKEGRPTIEALEEALEAIKFNNTPENRRIANEVRDRFVAEIEELLAEYPWRRNTLDRASTVVNRAAQKDSDRSIRELLDRVNAEVAAFKLVLMSVDVREGTATFRLHDPNFPLTEQTVREGDYVQGRFLVKRITASSVRLEDAKVETPHGFRTLLARLRTPVVGE